MPVITGDITLYGLGSGAGVTILRDSAAPDFRILKVDTGARLVLENITVSGGDAGSGSGGGIRNLGILELVNTIVENNVANGGGGIRNNDNATLISTDSTISNNTSTANGGGIYSNTGSTVTLTNTVLSGNQVSLSSGLGGGLYLNSASLSLSGGAFGGNQARNGAGLFVNGSPQPVAVSGTQFINNLANNEGGAIYLHSAAVSIEGATFTGNGAVSKGGAIRNGGTLTVTDSNFTGNNGGSTGGGGIANFSSLTLNNVQMDGNTVTIASGLGGAVFNQGAVTVNGGTFQNHAVRHGGAFYVDSGTLAADGAQILSNSATNRGGGVYFNGTLTGSYIHGSCLTGNNAPEGSAVYSGVSTLDATGNWWGADGANGQVNSRVDASSPLSDCTPQMQQMAAPLAMQSSETVAAISLPYLDSFESALNWSRSGTWSREAVGGYTEAGWAADVTLRSLESVLESRVAFSIPRNRDAVVHFWQMGSLSAEDRVLLEVQILGLLDWALVDEQLGLQSGWTERSVVLTGYRNQAVRLRWRVLSGSEETIGIEYRLDELRVETQR